MRYDKPKIQRLSNEAVFDLARELFTKGKSLKFVVSGNSMYPFIRHERDIVTLAAATLDEVKVMDIVLAYRANDGKYFLHRLVKKTADTFYMVGDAFTAFEGPIPASALIGVVTEVYRVNRRNGSEKLMSGPFYRLLIRLWRIVRPLRPAIIKLYFTIRRGRHG